jgi:hypothetical protein
VAKRGSHVRIADAAAMSKALPLHPSIPYNGSVSKNKA